MRQDEGRVLNKPERLLPLGAAEGAHAHCIEAAVGDDY
jgi:hypothetical protein